LECFTPPGGSFGGMGTDVFERKIGGGGESIGGEKGKKESHSNLRKGVFPNSF